MSEGLPINVDQSQIGSVEWFRNRASKVLNWNEDGQYWDFSDSLATWSPETAELYGSVQKETEYKETVTSDEYRHFAEIYPQLLELLPPIDLYVDLGPGTEEKEREFAHAMRVKNPEMIYVPVDVNKPMLDMAETRNTDLDPRPVQAPFEDVDKQLPSDKVVFASLGLTYINYQPEEIHTILKGIIGENGIALVNIQKREGLDIEELKGMYTDGHGFAKELFRIKLELIGLEEGSYNLEADNEIEVWAKITKQCKLINCEEVMPGERIKVFRSARYNPEDIERAMDTDFGKVVKLESSTSFVSYLLSD